MSSSTRGSIGICGKPRGPRLWDLNWIHRVMQAPGLWGLGRGSTSCRSLIPTEQRPLEPRGGWPGRDGTGTLKLDPSWVQATHPDRGWMEAAQGPGTETQCTGVACGQNCKHHWTRQGGVRLPKQEIELVLSSSQTYYVSKLDQTKGTDVRVFLKSLFPCPDNRSLTMEISPVVPVLQTVEFNSSNRDSAQAHLSHSTTAWFLALKKILSPSCLQYRSDCTLLSGSELL